VLTPARISSLLDAVPEPVSVKIHTAETGLYSSTAFHILNSMMGKEFVERDTTEKYPSGHKPLRLGSRAHVQLDLRQIAQPVTARLRAEPGETVNLTLREGKATPTRMMHVCFLASPIEPMSVCP
jgi:DNA-binding IclR family transcriptional regulator